MESWIQWAIGLAFVALTTMVGYIVSAHRSLAAKQSDDVKGLHVKIDEVKDTYVRHDDFATFRQETREQLQRIEDKTDSILGAMKH